MKKEKREPKIYEGIEWESNEELLVIQWLLELQSVGYIEKIERAESFKLSEAFENTYEAVVQLKTKAKVVEKKQLILHDHVYTPEFKVTWNEINKGDLTWMYYYDVSDKFTKTFIRNRVDDQPVSYIEVKPAFDQNNMTRLFKLNQKWMWDKHGIYVNLVEPYSLFEKTFTPEAAMMTPSGKPKKVNWEVKTLQEFLNTIKQNG